MANSTGRTSLTALILANLVPVVGTLFLGWEIRHILSVYWVESGIVAFYAILKMALCRGEMSPNNPPLPLVKIICIPFFMFHFGAFMFGHGLFILVMTGGVPDDHFFSVVLAILTADRNMPIAITVLVISHGISFRENYIGRGEFRNLNVKTLMTQPYARILVMHLTLIVGGFATIAAGESKVLCAILVLIKTAADARQHRRERRAGAGDLQPAAA